MIRRSAGLPSWVSMPTYDPASGRTALDAINPVIFPGAGFSNCRPRRACSCTPRDRRGCLRRHTIGLGTRAAYAASDPPLGAVGHARGTLRPDSRSGDCIVSLGMATPHPCAAAVRRVGNIESPSRQRFNLRTCNAAWHRSCDRSRSAAARSLSPDQVHPRSDRLPD